MSFSTLRHNRSRRRKGQIIEGTLAVVGIVTLAAAVYFGKQNSDMEREALKQTREAAAAAENRGTRSADALTEAANRAAKDLQVSQIGRATQIISAGGGPITDLVDLSMDAEDATQYYTGQIFGPTATEAQMAIIQQKAAAVSQEIRAVVPGLENNRRLVSYTLQQMMEQEKSTSNPKVLEGLRQQFPNKYTGLSDDELRKKLISNAISYPIHVTKRCYELAKKELGNGAELSQEQMDKLLAPLFNNTKDGLNEKAFKAALASAVAIKNAYGTYSGTFTGRASGSCRIIINEAGVTGTFTGSGALTGGSGTFSVTVNGDGPFSPTTGNFNGKLSGKLAYLSTIGPGTTSVKGSFRGQVGANGVKGTWSANALDEERTGSFTAQKKK